VGVEDYFYSDSSDTSLDDSITELETEELSGAVDQIRYGALGRISSIDIPKLISHLEVRSRHLRAGFLDNNEKLWSMTAERLQAPGLLRELFRSRDRNHPMSILNTTREQFKSQHLPIALAEPLARITAHTLANATDDFFAPFWKALLPIIEQVVKPKLRDIVKSAHLNALEKSISPEIRAQQYQQLTFRLVEIVSNDLLLGDSAVLFHVKGPRNFKPFLDKDDIIVAVFLPLSPNRIVVGTDSEYTVQTQSLRAEIVRCSHNFFIASEYSAANARLVTEIGTNALPLSDEDLREIVEDVVRENLK
jgi:hypothetical protein